MKLELKVTRRDKILLAVMGIAALLVGYVYFGVIRPTNRMEELTMEQELLEMQKQQVDMKLAQIPVYELAVANDSAAYEETIQSFHPIMTNDEVGAFVTDLMVDKGMKIQDLEIQSAKLMEIAPYLYSEKAKAQETEESAEQEYTETNPNQTEIVYSCEVSCRAIGDRSQVLEVLDVLSKEEGVRVSSFSVGDITRQVGRGENITYTKKKELDLKLVIYMCRK
ncbi:MAG: hypothetical protein IJ468_02455 [Lachnospiraceae bacterium]|nr:hypothetical protein [Lachnospiraceae bacterium]